MKKIILVSLLAIFVAACNKSEPVVKKSDSAGICHDKTSGSYKRLENYTGFKTMEACLASGGILPKNQQNDGNDSTPSNNNQGTSTAYAPPSKEYEREFFGHSWIDEDKDCMNTRHEILMSHAIGGSAKPKQDNTCQIAVGQWKSPFTDDIITSASAIDIDHIAPLKFAWTYGAEKWSEAKRLQFANDPENLLAVEASLNRSKGAQDITEWLPPKNQCNYITQFLTISNKYGLVFPQEKLTAFEAVRQTHCA